MGGSAGDRQSAQNPTMQSRNGICDKIENYISELGRWYVSNRGDSVREEPPCVFRPVPPYSAIGRKGVADPDTKVAGVCLRFVV